MRATKPAGSAAMVISRRRCISRWIRPPLRPPWRRCWRRGSRAVLPCRTNRVPMPFVSLFPPVFPFSHTFWVFSSFPVPIPLTARSQIMLLARTSHASLLPTMFALASPVAASLPPTALAVPLQQQQQQQSSHALSMTTTTTTTNTPVPLQASDLDGNTALHYASAYGQLKCIRALLEAGADPHRRNAWSWTAVNYSLSVQAEVYFKGLVGEGARGGAREA